MLKARVLRGAMTGHVLVPLPLVQHQIQRRHQSEGETRARVCGVSIATAAVADRLRLWNSAVL